MVACLIQLCSQDRKKGQMKLLICEYGRQKGKIVHDCLVQPSA